MSAEKIHNIGVGERRQRFLFGMLMLLIAAGLAFVLMLSGIHPLWRLTVILPLYMAGSGIFQASDGT